MNPLTRLLDHQPLTFVHLHAAAVALLLGSVILARRKGTPDHRLPGWAWVALMGCAVITSVFMRDHHMPNIAGCTPIHLLTVVAGVYLPLRIWRIRHGDVPRHRSAMRGPYIGGCIVTGLFTLVPNVCWGACCGFMHWDCCNEAAAMDSLHSLPRGFVLNIRHIETARRFVRRSSRDGSKSS